jgi:hypothetical protein
VIFESGIFEMTDPRVGTGHKRTAVLVVHGIGSQRALETVRGVIEGVWLDSDAPDDHGKRIWNHPEPSGTDIDLAVMTTNAVPGAKDRRQVDFHELYWAHLMSETKAVAVLLWLYELGRKGPIMKLGINGLWWAAAIFLCLMNLSIALLALQGVYLFSDTNPQAMLVAPFLLILSCIVFGFFVTLRYDALRLTVWLGAISAAGILVTILYFLVEWLMRGSQWLPRGLDFADLVTMATLPTLTALLATALLMRKPGLQAFWRAIGISAATFVVFLFVSWFWHPQARFGKILFEGWRPWSLNSPWSSVLAWAVVAFYLAVNAAFLQPYLGDAGRYFRGSPANVAVRRTIRKEAVDMLDRLHTSGLYDRIIVVAHSLGCVISYDMLRAYFSRVCDELPPVAGFGDDFKYIDTASWQPNQPASREEKKALRQKARNVIAEIAHATVNRPARDTAYRSWLVTDFVTLGNALTHAHFLMCLGESREDLEKDFQRRVREREFPTCPPKRLDRDGLLAFDNPKTAAKTVHHGALFGLTRWTNIYFPLEQLFWGDAIGGPVAPIFGSHIVDLPVSTRTGGGADFFTHTAYWDVERRPDFRNAPHIVALRNAVDLAESGTAISLVDEGVDECAVAARAGA